MGSPKAHERMVPHDHAGKQLRPSHAAVNPSCGQRDHEVPPRALEIKREFASAVGNRDIAFLERDLFATTLDPGVSIQVHAYRVEVTGGVSHFGSRMRGIYSVAGNFGYGHVPNDLRLYFAAQRGSSAGLDPHWGHVPCDKIL